MRSAAVRPLAASLGKSGKRSAEVRRALTDACREYHELDDQLWPDLLKLAHQELALNDSVEIGRGMARLLTARVGEEEKALGEQEPTEDRLQTRRVQQIARQNSLRRLRGLVTSYERERRRAGTGN